jgi:hypothetical protein
MSAIEELEAVVEELGIKQTIKALAVICSDCADDVDERDVEQWEDVAEALDDIDTEGLD